MGKHRSSHSCLLRILMYGVILCCFVSVSLESSYAENLNTQDTYLLEKNQQCTIWYHPVTKRLYEDTMPDERMAPRNTIELKLCKGEYGGFLVIVRPKQDVNDISFSFSALKSDTGEMTPVVEWHRVGAVDVDDKDKGGKRQTYDILHVDEQVQIKAGEYAVFFVRIQIPRGAVSGSYSGRMSAKAGDNLLCKTMLSARIYDFEIPKEPNIAFTAGFPKCSVSSNPLKMRKGDKAVALDIELVRDKWLRQISSYRMYNNNCAIPSPGRSSGNGKWILDFTAFDKRVDYLIGEGIRFRGRTPYMYFLGGKVWYMVERLFGDITDPPGDKTKHPSRTFLTNENIRPEFLQSYKAMVKTTVSHIEEKGYRDYFMDTVCDEPIGRLQHLCKKVASAVLEAHSGASPTLLGVPSSEAALKYFRGTAKHLFMHSQYINTLSDYLREGPGKKREDEILEVYNFPGLLGLQNEPLIARELFWWAWDARIDKLWHWNIGAWYRKSLVQTGYNLVYYNEDDPERLLTSIRFEQLREGLEDYECLRALALRAKTVRLELGADVVVFPDKYRSDELCAQLVKNHWLGDFCVDSGKYALVHGELLNDIEDMVKHPYVLLIMNPQDGSETVSDSVIFKGMTEDGTQIIFNGKRIKSVSGRFSVKSGLKMGENTFSFNMKKGADIKVIRRTVYRKRLEKRKVLINDTFTVGESSKTGHWSGRAWGKEVGFGATADAELVEPSDDKGNPCLASGKVDADETHFLLSRKCDNLILSDKGVISFKIYCNQRIEGYLTISSDDGQSYRQWVSFVSNDAFEEKQIQCSRFRGYRGKRNGMPFPKKVNIRAISINVREQQSNITESWQFFIDDFVISDVE